MPQIGPLEIAVVLLVALLVFGPDRLPELARQVGGALRELRRIQQDLKADLHEMMADESAGAAPAPTLPPLSLSEAEAIEAGDPSTGGPAAGDPAVAGGPEVVAPPPDPD